MTETGNEKRKTTRRPVRGPTLQTLGAPEERGPDSAGREMTTATIPQDFPELSFETEESEYPPQWIEARRDEIS